MQECTGATSIRVPSRRLNHNVQNFFLFKSIKGGALLLQVILGGTGTRPKAGVAHEFILKKMLVAVGFAYN